MKSKKHFQIVLASTLALMVVAVLAYTSYCKPTFMIGLCSAIKLTRVSFIVLTTLNFIIISTIAFNLKIKSIKKSAKSHIFIIYAFLLIASFALALFEISLLTAFKFSG